MKGPFTWCAVSALIVLKKVYYIIDYMLQQSESKISSLFKLTRDVRGVEMPPL